MITRTQNLFISLCILSTPEFQDLKSYILEHNSAGPNDPVDGSTSKNVSKARVKKKKNMISIESVRTKTKRTYN